MTDLGDCQYGATAPENVHAGCQKEVKRNSVEDQYPTSTLNQQPDSEVNRDDSETKSTRDQKSSSASGAYQTGGPEGPGDRSIHSERQESPVPSVLSMTSDWSMEPAITFRGDSFISTNHDASVPGLVPCCICPVKAVKFCVTCCASYCDLHVWPHYIAPALQKHRLVEMAGDVVEQKFFQQHHRELELYCSTDHTLFDQPEDQTICFGEVKSPNDKGLPPPGPIQFTSVTSDSVSLCWGTPEGMTGPQRFRVNWKQELNQQSLIVPVSTITIEGLSPGKEYEFSVASISDSGSQSPCVVASTQTALAPSRCFLSEEQLRCSICLDMFTDPVSTPCGHIFCMVCIKTYWDNCSQSRCPVCNKTYSTRPELCLNTSPSEMTAQFRTLVTEKKSTEKEISASVEVFTALLRSIERSQAELLEVMKEKQRAAERQAEGLIKDLLQEITELQRMNNELEKISHTEDHLYLLQIYPALCSPPHTKNWADVSMDPELWTVKVCEERMKILKRAVSELSQLFNKEMDKLGESKLKVVKLHAVDVTLDPDSAHMNLILSAGGKQVRDGDKQQNLPDKPERFDRCPNILGKEGFSSGRFYYEVEVKWKTEWDLGVARESINRKGKITLAPQNGYWTLWLRNGKEYSACAGFPIALSLSKKPQKVGVFVDYEEGLVSFYDVENSSHIYSFTGQTFSEILYPFFSPGLNDEGKNATPLIISPVIHANLLS
uniref:E3 ubiquitin-protein ligase TRIM39-like n=1 Tax=Denticeps clupeoides TaxID=299321 RepID=A0AAY4A0Z8_9TELE